MCSRVCDLEDTLNIEYIKDWGWLLWIDWHWN
jgi:hypothetical protein